MNASARKAADLIRNRRRRNKKRSLSTAVAAVTQDTKTARAVTTAMRKVARKLRLNETLGRVQARFGFVAPGQRGTNYRYTADQVQQVAAAYRPRKAEYQAVRTALLAF